MKKSMCAFSQLWWQAISDRIHFKWTPVTFCWDVNILQGAPLKIAYVSALIYNWWTKTAHCSLSIIWYGWSRRLSWQAHVRTLHESYTMENGCETVYEKIQKNTLIEYIETVTETQTRHGVPRRLSKRKGLGTETTSTLVKFSQQRSIRSSIIIISCILLSCIKKAWLL